MSDESIEAQVVAKGLTAPRITKANILDLIASEHYFTAKDGAMMKVEFKDCNKLPPSLGLHTFCVLVLKDGFTVSGESCVVSAANFDADIGKQAAYENAINKIWGHEGYLLKYKLWAAEQIRPTYYVQHPDGSHTAADPQPLL